MAQLQQRGEVGGGAMGRPRRKVWDLALVYLYTEAGDHQHTAIFDDAGDGLTTPGPDGHVHQIVGLEVQPAAGHTHALGCERAPVVDYVRYWTILLTGKQQRCTRRGYKRGH